LHIDADGGSDHAGLACDLAVALNFVGKGRRQFAVVWNVQCLLVGEARPAAAAFSCVKREPRFDLSAPKAVGHRLVAAACEEIAKALVVAPEIERGIFVLDRAEAAALAQQEAFEVELGDGIEERSAALGAAADDADIVVGRQPMGIVGDHHGPVPLFETRRSALSVAYCATPLPNDQFSGRTSTRLMKTSSGRTPGSTARLSTTWR
jgi:hypothetical protein